LKKRKFTSKIVLNATAHVTIDKPSKNVLKRNPSSWARKSKPDKARI
jgi:hypothetical protein